MEHQVNVVGIVTKSAFIVLALIPKLVLYNFVFDERVRRYRCLLIFNTYLIAEDKYLSAILYEGVFHRALVAVGEIKCVVAAEETALYRPISFAFALIFRKLIDRLARALTEMIYCADDTYASSKIVSLFT